MKLIDGFLHDAVRMGDPLVLAQMLQPRLHLEHFEEPAFHGGVLEHAPP